MCGLLQVGILVNKLLKEHLIEHGYYEVKHPPGLFCHKTRPVWFTLVADDFGIKYVDREHAEHLIKVLKEFYEVEEDWNCALYCDIDLKWNYDERYDNVFVLCAKTIGALYEHIAPNISRWSLSLRDFV
ncbi:hypothetical protein ACHAWF_001740 [Thalassiosira exigua]